MITTVAMNRLYNLPQDVQDLIWRHVHLYNFKKIHQTFKKMHNKFCLWENPSQTLLDLVTYDEGCIQHPYTDFYKFRNKKYCNPDGPGCQYSPAVCVDCLVIRSESPWTSTPHDAGLYKCGNCKCYGFPCRNCATFFRGKIQPEIFYANF